MNKKPKEVTYPESVEDVIKLLDRLYPDRCPDLKMSDREVWYKAGQRSVVDYLLYLKKRYEENVLKHNTKI